MKEVTGQSYRGLTTPPRAGTRVVFSVCWPLPHQAGTLKTAVIRLRWPNFLLNEHFFCYRFLPRIKIKFWKNSSVNDHEVQTAMRNWKWASGQSLVQTQLSGLSVSSTLQNVHEPTIAITVEPRSPVIWWVIVLGKMKSVSRKCIPTLSCYYLYR